MTVCVHTPTKALIDADWSTASEDVENAKQIPAEEFYNAMDKQLVNTKEVLNGLSDAEVIDRDTILPTNQSVKLGPALINFPLKFVSAYRMQLFLYLKSIGKSELNTFNCWFGIDPMPSE